MKFKVEVGGVDHGEFEAYDKAQAMEKVLGWNDITLETIESDRLQELEEMGMKLITGEEITESLRVENPELAEEYSKLLADEVEE